MGHGLRLPFLAVKSLNRGSPVCKTVLLSKFSVLNYAETLNSITHHNHFHTHFFQ